MRKQTDSAEEKSWKWLVGAVIEVVAYDEEGIISMKLKPKADPERDSARGDYPMWLTAHEISKDQYEGAKLVKLRLMIG